MDLSIIIVNYNVKYFLEQCLISVKAAVEGVSAEIFVVDNASSDDSVDLIRQKFPEINLIANSENLGFSKANNQAIHKANGQYILLLNPDTVVESDTFYKCLDYMGNNTSVGALGVRMIDGSGAFLPESKRGFPSPWAAFCKFVGLSSLFPNSKTFNQYHLGYLKENETSEVDVLSGAFMMLRKKALDKSGLLDEAYFMYGEDIDLSVRIKQNGYKVVYFPGTSIIHYKGESTKKSSLNYVKIFYNAMVIFSEKHFSGEKKNMYLFFLKMAIYLRAILSLFKRMVGKVLHPLIDFSLFFFGLIFLKNFWASFYFQQPDYYEHSNILFNFSLYSIIWIVSLLFAGAYDRYFKVRNIFKGLLIGSLVILVIYGLLNPEYRSSRALVLLGFIAALCSAFFTRILLHFLRIGDFSIGKERVKKTIIVGSKEEAARTLNLIKKSDRKISFAGFLYPDGVHPYAEALSSIKNLPDIISSKNVDQVVFCSKDISIQEIMDEMTNSSRRVEYKIVAREGMSIIGSTSKNVRGDLYTMDLRFNLDEIFHLRNKRTFDIIFSILLILTAPFLVWIQINKTRYLQNIITCLIGFKTWIGYHQGDPKLLKLPPLRKSVIELGKRQLEDGMNPKAIHKLNLIYAKNYSIYKDLDILWNHMKHLGN
jgi:GT2 family glycosyltransferase